MKLLIVSTAPFIYKGKDVYAYGPYVKELLVWNKNSDEIAFCCPTWESERGLLVSKLPFEINKQYKLIDLNGLTFTDKIQSFFWSFYNIGVLFKAMQKADHIHLRCPGNVGLLGCFIQILFPGKPKTAKYAGNWDPKAQQPWSYRLQKWILNNTLLTRNMQVLVYGEWDNQTKNIKPFFTASYSEKDKKPLEEKSLVTTIHFVFVGALVKGKNPLYAIQLVERLLQNGFSVTLSIYGDGKERVEMEEYILKNNLQHSVCLYGNQNQETLKRAYQQSHFVVLPSISEGWPKAIAEGMFWGCVPIATSVSCVPEMLADGIRGILLQMKLDKDVEQIEALIQNQALFDGKSKAASIWAREYTLEVFEQEIEKFLV